MPATPRTTADALAIDESLTLARSLADAPGIAYQRVLSGDSLEGDPVNVVHLVVQSPSGERKPLILGAVGYGDADRERSTTRYLHLTPLLMSRCSARRTERAP